MAKAVMRRALVVGVALIITLIGMQAPAQADDSACTKSTSPKMTFEFPFAQGRTLEDVTVTLPMCVIRVGNTINGGIPDKELRWDSMDNLYPHHSRFNKFIIHMELYKGTTKVASRTCDITTIINRWNTSVNAGLIGKQLSKLSCIITPRVDALFYYEVKGWVDWDIAYDGKGSGRWNLGKTGAIALK